MKAIDHNLPRTGKVLWMDDTHARIEWHYGQTTLEPIDREGLEICKDEQPQTLAGRILKKKSLWLGLKNKSASAVETGRSSATTQKDQHFDIIKLSLVISSCFLCAGFVMMWLLLDQGEHFVISLAHSLFSGLNW